MKTVIMAGGRGTRIASIAGDLPKPMLALNGKPVLEREICSLREQGFTDLILTVSYKSEAIIRYFGDGSRFGVHIEYFEEKIPLGNAGALILMREKLKDGPFLLLNADTIFDVDFHRMLAFSEQKQALVTLFVHPNNHPYDSGLLLLDDSGCVQRWLTKEDPHPAAYRNTVNAGLHVIDPSILFDTDIDPARLGTTDPETGSVVKADLDRQLLRPLAGTGRMFGYRSPEYVKDMGTPARFAEVQRDALSGKISARNLKAPQKAIFLDRDGTINQYRGYIRKPEELELIDGAAEAIRRINASEYLCIVVTNQPVVARGDVTLAELQKIHNRMETLLGHEGAFVDAIYFCPHHPDRGFEGEVPALKIECSCRKPKPGLLLQAAEQFHIDLSQSWMVGDGETDVLAGRAAGCRTAFLERAEQEHFGADLAAASLKEFTDRLFGEADAVPQSAPVCAGS